MYVTPPPSYSILPHLLETWDRTDRPLRYTAATPTQWRAWRQQASAKLKAITGYDRLRPAPLEPRITESVELENHVRQRVEIQTEAGVIMPFYALLPKNRDAPFVPVLAPHGHGSGGKAATAGLRDDPDIAAAIDHYNYAYGLQLVTAGYAAFCPDACGFGERHEAHHEGKLNGSCRYINQMALPLGRTVTGIWAFELSRLVDYIQTRPDCVHDRVGCVGLSGGGLQTLWATALDDRITCAVVSGYFYGYKQALLEQYNNCSCNYVPGLFELLDIADIAALVAPRPLLIESGDQDPLNGRDGIENVERQVVMARRAWQTTGAPEGLRHVVFSGGHRYAGHETVAWLQRWLGQR